MTTYVQCCKVWRYKGTYGRTNGLNASEKTGV